MEDREICNLPVFRALFDGWLIARLAQPSTCERPDMRLRREQPEEDESRRWRPAFRPSVAIALIALIAAAFTRD